MSPSQIWASQVALVGKNSPANARDLRDMGLIPGWGRSPGLGRSPREGHGNPLQYACLENPMDRGAWWSPWGRKELDTTEQLSTHSIWMYYYMVICLLWSPPMISGHQISWHHGSGWKCQYWVDSMAHTTGRWNTAVMDILCFSVDGSTVTTLESLQIHSKRNWKLMSYNQNWKFVCRIPTVSEEDIWVSSE